MRRGTTRVFELQALNEELNATPTVMPTDPRPLTYQLAEA